MTGDGVRRLTAWSALSAVVVGAVGFLLIPGSPPGFDAPPEQVLRWTLAERRSALVGSVLVAVAFAILVVFVVGLRAMLARAEGGPAVLSTVGYGAFLAVVSLVLVAVALAQVQSFVALDGDPAAVKMLHEARFLVANAAAVPGIVSLAAFGTAMLRSGFPARSAGAIAWLAAAARLPTLASLARTGFFSPTGAGPVIGVVALAIWVVVVGAMFVVRPRTRSAD